jgi:hypothetical protein
MHLYSNVLSYLPIITIVDDSTAPLLLWEHVGGVAHRLSRLIGRPGTVSTDEREIYEPIRARRIKVRAVWI